MPEQQPVLARYFLILSILVGTVAFLSFILAGFSNTVADILYGNSEIASSTQVPTITSSRLTEANPSSTNSPSVVTITVTKEVEKASPTHQEL